MATPFVQGRLRNEFLSVTIASECAHCHRPLTITVDSEMHLRVHDAEADPMVFYPEVNWRELTDPTIIDAY